MWEFFPRPQSFPFMDTFISAHLKALRELTANLRESSLCTSLLSGTLLKQSPLLPQTASLPPRFRETSRLQRVSSPVLQLRNSLNSKLGSNRTDFVSSHISGITIDSFCWLTDDILKTVILLHMLDVLSVSVVRINWLSVSTSWLEADILAYIFHCREKNYKRYSKDMSYVS